MESKEKAEWIMQLMEDKKALDVEKLDISSMTVIADYFVICTGTSSTHVKGIVDEIEFQLKERGILLQRMEGYDSARWVLMDYGDVVAHVFYEEDRQYYSLERRWKSGL